MRYHNINYKLNQLNHRAYWFNHKSLKSNDKILLYPTSQLQSSYQTTKTLRKFLLKLQTD